MDEAEGKSADSYKREIEVNEVLCFLSSKFNNYPVSMIKKTILEFYREDEICAAKLTLLKFAGDQGLAVQQFARNRIGPNKCKATLDDIMNIWSAADENDVIDKLPVFCVADLS